MVDLVWSQLVNEPATYLHEKHPRGSRVIEKKPFIFFYLGSEKINPSLFCGDARLFAEEHLRTLLCALFLATYTSVCVYVCVRGEIASVSNLHFIVLDYTLLAH